MTEPDSTERWTLLRGMLGTDSSVSSEALAEMCGMVELMLDPHKQNKDRLSHGRPVAEELLRRYDAQYGTPPADVGGRRFYDGPRLAVLVDEIEQAQGGPGPTDAGASR